MNEASAGGPVCQTCGRYHGAWCPGPYIPVPFAAPSMVAGHCGKCGAPYTQDLTVGSLGAQPKFTPSCKCWNV